MIIEQDCDRAVRLVYIQSIVILITSMPKAFDHNFGMIVLIMKAPRFADKG